jgi:glycosyltransferase involved in cell wall biosynthesis
MVSICIPTYNQVEFLPAAVESALAQDFPALEVVISENLSTDGTAAYLAGLRDPRLRIVTPQRHLTMSDNWRFCVDQSRGHYFAILSSDDILLPGFAKKLAAALEAHPDAAFVYCALQTIN